MFWIIDQIFVVHLEQIDRENPLPVVHQIIVIFVISANRSHVLAIGLKDGSIVAKTKGELAAQTRTSDDLVLKTSVLVVLIYEVTDVNTEVDIAVFSQVTIGREVAGRVVLTSQDGEIVR